MGADEIELQPADRLAKQQSQSVRAHSPHRTNASDANEHTPTATTQDSAGWLTHEMGTASNQREPRARSCDLPASFGRKE